jgi:UDP-2,3-diacylglucosamine pyrophosphatase LpxH
VGYVAPPSSPPLRESLLVLSDVHLGSDLNDHVGVRVRRSTRIDEDLVALLAHYRGTPARGDRWRLVVAGDFIDLIGITILPKDVELATAPSDEERQNGLGNAADHARIKVQRVAERHRNVFAALAAFVAEGHALTFVHGNHDVELYWDEVKAEISEQIAAARAGAAEGWRGGDEERAAFVGRIEYAPWFFYADGLAYIEHGHQYDEFCAADHFMAPVSPRDPRRIQRGFCDVLIRFVVRQTRGMREYGHEKMGVVDYLRFAARLGGRGMVRLLVHFVAAVRELFRVRSEHFLEAARALREEHERRVALLAEARRIGLDRLRALAALQAPPVTRSIFGILASVLLDRLALALLCSLALVVAGLVFGLRGGHHAGAWAAASIVVAWAVAHRYLTRRRKVDADDVLVDRAARLARLFPAAFVVMGHTHVPMRVPIGEQTTYINVGSWAEEEAEEDNGAKRTEEEAKAVGEGAGVREETYRAARTHLVITRGDAGPIAEFLAWESDRGPRRFASDAGDDGARS